MTSAAGTLHHTCFLVHDVDATAERLAASLGIGPWHVWTIAPDECTVHGQPTAFSFRVALAEHGGASYELLAPIAGPSVYADHLAAHGEGFHHTCHIFPTRSAMLEAQADLLAQGREMIQSASSGESFAFCYFAISETASILELLHLAEMPPPDRAIG